MEIVQTDDQICKYLSLKWALARALQNCIGYLEEEVKIQLTGPTPIDQEIEMIKDGLATRTEELAAILGETTLINCPIVDCPTHTNQTNQSDSIVTNLGAKNNDNEINPSKNRVTIKIIPNKKIPKNSNNVNNDKENSKTKNRPAGQEDFKTPNKNLHVKPSRYRSKR
ncbi:uncharacterized protein TNCV_3947281 [Trichonephila clavipes]|nr:uncharacterized protein TNCV_3947281 [Trichonephila clavipes]